MKKAAALAATDFRNIVRDGMLIATAAAPVLIGLFLRFGLPAAGEVLWRHLRMDAAPYYHLVAAFFLMLTPMLVGILNGLVMLDEREEGILQYLAITPLSRGSYLLYRLALPTLAGALFAYLQVVIAGLPGMDYGLLAPVALMTALGAPLIAMFLAAFAENRVEGLAISKALGFLFLAPLADYLIKSPWKLLLGIFPTFWPPRAFLAAYNGEAALWAYIAGGVAVHLVMSAVLLKIFTARAG